MRKILISILAGALVLTTQEAEAAKRTIQFVGAAISHTQKIRVDQFNQYTACSVVIVNTGTVGQKVTDVKFYAFGGPGGSLTDVTPSLEAVYLRGDSSPNCTTPASSVPVCTSSTIVGANGGFYVGIAYIAPSVLAGKAITLCSGYFEVEDENSATPGSMIASGAISYVTEIGITGGQFSGALYVSGSHVQGNPSSAAAPFINDAPYVSAGGVSNAASTFGAVESGQMNLYCANACLLSPDHIGNTQYCNAVCGNASYPAAFTPELRSLDASHLTRNSSAFIEEFNSDVPSGGPAGARPFHDLTDPGDGQMRGLIRHANPHFAGGYVQEMIIGPFESICSGNAGYATAGGADFSHSESIDADQAFIVSSGAQSLVKTNAPPERLYCSHTHQKDSPFGYVSNAIQFSINGGMAF